LPAVRYQMTRPQRPEPLPWQRQLPPDSQRGQPCGAAAPGTPLGKRDARPVVQRGVAVVCSACATVAVPLMRAELRLMAVPVSGSWLSAACV